MITKKHDLKKKGYLRLEREWPGSLEKTLRSAVMKKTAISI